MSEKRKALTGVAAPMRVGGKWLENKHLILLFIVSQIQPAVKRERGERL